jgi:hypothetical protein
MSSEAVDNEFEDVVAKLVAKSRRQHGNILPPDFKMKEQPKARTPDRRWKGTYPKGSVTAPTRRQVEDHLFLCALNP